MRRAMNMIPTILRYGFAGAVALLAASPVSAEMEGPARLHERYVTLEPKLRASVFNAPIYIESNDRDGLIRGEAYGVLPHAFTVFSATIQQPAAWCDFATLHFNIKGCVYRSRTGSGILTIYSGGKQYEDPRNARRHEFLYTVRAATHDYLNILITSDDGPIDTSDYRIEVAAVALGNQTFAQVRFSYRYRTLTRMMSATYFATLGRNKIGFTVIDRDKDGNPVYIKGRSGGMERSVMRFYLGLQALFESLAQPESERFEWRIRRWYVLTDKYRRQLYELAQDEYLDTKRKERASWLRLQSELDSKR